MVHCSVHVSRVCEQKNCVKLQSASHHRHIYLSLSGAFFSLVRLHNFWSGISLFKGWECAGGWRGRGSVNRLAGSWTFEKSWAEILGIIKKGRVDDVSELRRVKNSYSWLITESDPNRVVFFYCIFNQKPIRYLLQWLLAFVLRHLLGCATDVHRTELHLASGLGLGLARWWSLILSV